MKYLITILKFNNVLLLFQAVEWNLRKECRKKRIWLESFCSSVSFFLEPKDRIILYSACHPQTISFCGRLGWHIQTICGRMAHRRLLGIGFIWFEAMFTLIKNRKRKLCRLKVGVKFLETKLTIFVAVLQQSTFYVAVDKRILVWCDWCFTLKPR